MIFAFKTPRRVPMAGIDRSGSAHDAEPVDSESFSLSTPARAELGSRDSVETGRASAYERPAAVNSIGNNGRLWTACFAVYLVLATGAYVFDHAFSGRNLTLIALLGLMSALSALAPASGPRGQRLFLLPGMGMASMLLLPPITAALPLLLANAVYSALRETAAARRVSLLRGVWLCLATLLAGFATRMHAVAGHSPANADAIVGAAFFCTMYIAGRRTDLARISPAKPKSSSTHAPDAVVRLAPAPVIEPQAPCGARAHTWYELECTTLLASAPFAVFMMLSYAKAGMPGLGMTCALSALVVLIAHYGFEVSMLREQVRAMEKISVVTWSQTSPKRVVDRFIQLSSKLIPWDRTVLWLTDHSQTRLETAVKVPLDPAGLHGPLHNKSVRFGEGLVGRVADHQNPMIVRDASSDPRYTELEDDRRGGVPFSIMLLPLVVAGETIGVAQFERETPQSYSSRDVARIQPLASQAAATIANVRAHQDVYNQAVTDALTGLFNRRHMQSVLADERRRAERYGHVLSVIMLDVDGFKGYNDTYGHPQGDVLLKQLAEILRDNVRDVDIVGRYGGEEFIIVMPETSKDEALFTAERLRNAVASAVFPGHAGPNGGTVRKTISLGVASFPIDTDDPHTLVSKADQALYHAKHAGRNRTVLAGQAVSPPHVIVAEGPVAR